MARPSRALLLQSLLFLVALPTEAQTPASVASSVASTTASSDRAYQNTRNSPGLPAKCLQGSRASETEKWCMTVTTNSHLGDYVLPGSECPAHPSVSATFVNQDDCLEEASCCCFSSKIDCGKMATAYNDRHSPSVSETCQFYTVNATNESLALCQPACLNQIDILQYPLRLPGPAGGKPGSCAPSSKCPNGGDILRCCSFSTIASWNGTSRLNNMTGRTIADTCTNKVSCTYDGTATYKAHDPDSPATYGMLMGNGPEMRPAYMHRPIIAGPPISCSGPYSLSTFDKVAIGCGAVIMLVLVTYLLQSNFGLAKTTAKLREKDSLQERLLDQAHGEMARRDQVWQIPVDHVRFMVQLAAGAFSEVWKGAYGGQAVAIKLLRRAIDDEDGTEAAEEFRRETTTLQQIRHPNLLIFLGSGITAENKPFLVTEFMELGSLRGVLADAGRTLVWAVRERMAAGIATGMSHLHSLKIVHRDLKSDNCLCDADLNTKIADFGTAKLVQASKTRGPTATDETTAETAFSTPGVGQSGTPTMTTGIGTPLWMAPEVFAGGSRYGPEVDVYSYGVIMWELLTRRQPWDELEATQYIKFKAELSAALEAGRRPAVKPTDAEAHPQYVALMAKCWAGDPHARPTFENVSSSLTL